jgi:sugar-phosphatase
MIKAVIFDMDGLLIDSEPFWRKAHIAVLAEDGFVITEDDVRGMAGRGTSQVVEEWRTRFGWDISKNPVVEERIVTEVFRQVQAGGKALPGATELIRELELHQVPMAVASSSGPELIDAVLRKLDIHHYMQAVHSGKHEKRSKPFPDVFLSAANSLGVAPANCLVFEDSLNGVKAAKAAGMKCIAVPEEPYDEVAFAAANPDRVVPSLTEVHWHDINDL